MSGSFKTHSRTGTENAGRTRGRGPWRRAGDVKETVECAH
jgi:hypothetical protein